MTDYSSISYWDERYASDDTIFDWYQDFTTLKSYITPYLKFSPDFEILVPGCGNSSLSADLYDCGYHNITNIDTSSVLIAQMNDRFADREDMEFTIMDARNMEYLPNECFNCIIDKALFDTFLCSNTNHSDIHAYITEMFRILKSEGKFIIISHGNPDSGRIEFVRNNLNVDYGWEEDVECKHIVKPPVRGVQETTDASKNHYMYVFTKKHTNNQSSNTSTN